ncbi:hypothetical protein O6H91_14G060200 [Diphasiastrum complanatum]|uniref:Uncharacterized protein n=1 Tax=Diphasiastrum complanatum TaxID=34168 RepID=A0ACC2BQ54_DIPCM|nr:hypothetical protein O6H91_14G060200 [Diphasiastrum complanatum]
MASKLMQAVQYAKYGGKYEALQQVEVPVPTPKKDEVLVKIGAASVNPVDWKIQSGILRPFLPAKFPHIPGTDVAGEIVSVGPGVTEFSAGENVVTWLDIRTGGSLAKYAAASVKYTAKRPMQVSAVEAACLPVAAMTALQSVRDSAGVNLDGSYKGDILITAASGGVGTFAVQLAKLGGAHVTATCGSRNIELVKSLGADEVLDYKSQEGSDLKSPSGRKYDAIVNCTTGIPWSKFRPVLKANAKVIDLTPSVTGLATSVLTKLSFSKQRLVPLFMSANSKDLQILVDLVKEGKLKTLIDSKFSLEEAKDAWKRSVEGHATGKIVVVVDESVQ